MRILVRKLKLSFRRGRVVAVILLLHIVFKIQKLYRGEVSGVNNNILMLFRCPFRKIKGIRCAREYIFNLTNMIYSNETKITLRGRINHVCKVENVHLIPFIFRK